MSKTGEGIFAQSQEKRDLLALLEEVQSKFSYLSQESIAELAAALGLSISEVYGSNTDVGSKVIVIGITGEIPNDVVAVSAICPRI